MPPNIESGRRSFVFILRIASPPDTLASLLHFITDRGIVLESLYMQSAPAQVAQLVIHCRIERDRIRHTVHLMEKVTGIIELEWLESRGSSSYF